MESFSQYLPHLKTFQIRNAAPMRSGSLERWPAGDDAALSQPQHRMWQATTVRKSLAEAIAKAFQRSCRTNAEGTPKLKLIVVGSLRYQDVWHTVWPDQPSSLRPLLTDQATLDIQSRAQTFLLAFSQPKDWSHKVATTHRVE